jgi:hypothetical protein
LELIKKEEYLTFEKNVSTLVEDQPHDEIILLFQSQSLGEHIEEELSHKDTQGYEEHMDVEEVQLLCESIQEDN